MSIDQKPGMFYLGKLYNPKTGKVEEEKPLLYASKNLTTHALCVGMTGSGKTGLGITILEEAALSSIPCIIIDPKGDMGNILLTFPDLSPEEFKPWIDHGEAERKGKSAGAYAAEVATAWKEGLEAWNETPKRIQDLKNTVSMAIYTPASKAGIPLSILSSFEAPSKEFALDQEVMRERVLSTTSSLLGLLGVSADPITSRQHILISTVIAEGWKAGKDLDLAYLIEQVQNPGFDKIGVLDIDTFYPPKERMELSIQLNNLLASPRFQAWMEGAPLNIQELLYTSEQKPKVSVISIAHLNDSERMFFVTLFLNQLINWMRKQPGTSSLRALFYMDEILGFFPPIATPPSKMPMMMLLKQARAFGLGMVLTTQNPVDLDYKGLSNCGTWFIGRLQTARDRSRVLEGLASASNGEIDSKAIDTLMSYMDARVFILRSIYEKEPILFQTRWALSYLRGPLTLAQMEILTKDEKKDFKNGTLSDFKTDEENKSSKPIIPPSIPQYFFFSSNTASQIRYRPFIAGFCKLHFIEKKYEIDTWVNPCLVVEAEEGEKSLPWNTAKEHADLKEALSKMPIENATYGTVPAQLLQEKNYPRFKQELVAYLYQNNTLKLFEHKETKQISKTEETEESFRDRVAQGLKEKQAELIEKLENDYTKKITALKEKIRKAAEKKDQKEQRTLYQKLEAFVSFITTMIGAFFGKKVTKTTINQAGTTFKRIGRVGKESQDAAQAEATLEALQAELQETEKELNNEVTKASAAIDPKSLQLDEVIIRPRKTDITIDEIALVWWP